jgi:hypothetical protein
MGKNDDEVEPNGGSYSVWEAQAAYSRLSRVWAAGSSDGACSGSDSISEERTVRILTPKKQASDLEGEEEEDDDAAF